MPEIKELKPLKLPGEKDPTQAISTCPYCNSCVNQTEQECPNCHQVITPHQGRPHPRKVPQKGERYEDYGPKFDYIVQAGSGRRRKKDKDIAEDSEETVKDEFSVDVDMCIDPFEKKKRNDDVRKEEIMRSCRDLAIDG